MSVIMSISLRNDQADWLRLMGMYGKGFSKYVQRKIDDDMSNSSEALHKRKEALEDEIQIIDKRIRVFEGQTTLFQRDDISGVRKKLYDWYKNKRTGITLHGGPVDPMEISEILKIMSGKQWDADFELIGSSRREFVMGAERRMQQEDQVVFIAGSKL